MTEEKIREFSGQIIGIVEYHENGDKVARTFPSRKVVGKYDAKNDYTRDFYGVVVAKGDSVVNLIYKNREF